MTAAELQAIAREAQERTQMFRGFTEQARMVGLMAGADK